MYNVKGQAIELSCTVVSKRPIFVDWLKPANANLQKRVFVIVNMYSKPVRFGGCTKIC